MLSIIHHYIKCDSSGLGLGLLFLGVAAKLSAVKQHWASRRRKTAKHFKLLTATATSAHQLSCRKRGFNQLLQTIMKFAEPTAEADRANPDFSRKLRASSFLLVENAHPWAFSTFSKFCVGPAAPTQNVEPAASLRSAELGSTELAEVTAEAVRRQRGPSLARLARIFHENCRFHEICGLEQ